MYALLFTALTALWAAGVVMAVSLCAAAGTADREDGARRRLLPLRLISNR